MVRFGSKAKAQGRHQLVFLNYQVQRDLLRGVSAYPILSLVIVLATSAILGPTRSLTADFCSIGKPE